MLAVRQKRIWTVMILAVALAACSGEPTGPVDRPAVAAVDVTPSAIALTTGDTIRLRAVPRAASGAQLNDRPVTWSSSDTSVATVAGTGLVLAREKGFAEIRAVAEGQTGKATVAITDRATQSPALLRVSPASVAAGSGAFSLSVFGTDFAPGAVVLWDGAPRPTTRLDATELRAAISADEVATERTVRIAVRNPEPHGGQSGEVLFLITPSAEQSPVAYVTVTPDVVTLPARSQVQLQAAAHAADGTVLTGRQYTWTSLGPATATVDQTGTVTAHRAGNVRVRVESEGKAAHAEIDVISAVEFLTITPNSATLSVGSQMQFHATAHAADGSVLMGRQFRWTSTAGGTASVDQMGNVTARNVGVALIIVESEGRSAQARIDVVQPVAVVIVVPSSTAVLVGLRVQLRAQTYSSSGGALEGRVITWSSEDPTVATVDADGWVTGIRKGATRVLAESEGKVGWATVEVRQFADGPTQTYELRGLVHSPIMPSVGNRTWADEQGFAHDATLFLRGGLFRINNAQSSYEQDLTIEVVVSGRGVVAVETWSDRGSWAYAVPTGGYVFTSSVTQSLFLGLPAGAGEMIVEQEIGTAPQQHYRWVVR